MISVYYANKSRIIHNLPVSIWYNDTLNDEQCCHKIEKQNERKKKFVVAG